MTLYDVPAPAKLNLFLHVVGRRPDGYHLLQTVFRFIDLCDTLTFERRADGQVVCETPMQGLAAEDDLVVRAARALQKATGTAYGAQIAYKKRIPSGGGLGGGSSDAATTLIALNRLWSTGLDRGELMRLAGTLGADVPVFVFGQPAFAEGVGDVLTAVDVPDCAYLVVQPTQNVPTKDIFSDPDLTRDSPCIKISVFADWQNVQAGNGAGSCKYNRSSDNRNSGSTSSSQSPGPGFTFFGRNDLQPVVFSRYPKVFQAHSWLESQGIAARMTGSGACLFASFSTLAQAEMLRLEIIGKIANQENGSKRNQPGQEGVINNAWACPGLVEHPLQHWLHS